MSAKPERIIVEISAVPDGGQMVSYEYVPATPEAGPEDQQAALEMAIHHMLMKAVAMRTYLGQPVPPAMQAMLDTRSFLDFRS
jgi:hypothetical protein